LSMLRDDVDEVIRLAHPLDKLGSKLH